MRHQNLRRSILMGGGALLLAVSALLGGTGGARAATACRTDPIITLSDLRVLDMTTIFDSGSDLKSVKYVLHGPVGVRILTVLPTPNLTAGTETFTYVADQPASTYVMDTTVTTGTSKISVTASTVLVSVLTNTTLYVSSTNGLSGSMIAMPFHDKPLL